MPPVLQVFLRIWSQVVLDEAVRRNGATAQEKLKQLGDLIYQIAGTASPEGESSSPAARGGRSASTETLSGEDHDNLLVEDMALLADVASSGTVAAPLMHVLRAIQCCSTGSENKAAFLDADLDTTPPAEHLAGRCFRRAKLYLMMALAMWAASSSHNVEFMVEHMKAVLSQILMEEMENAIHFHKRIGAVCISAEHTLENSKDIPEAEVFRAVVFTFILCTFSWSCNVLFQASDITYRVCSRSLFQHSTRSSRFIALLKHLAQQLDGQKVAKSPVRLATADGSLDAVKEWGGAALNSSTARSCKDRKSDPAPSELAPPPLLHAVEGRHTPAAHHHVREPSSSGKSMSETLHVKKIMSNSSCPSDDVDSSSISSSQWILYSGPTARSTTANGESGQLSHHSNGPPLLGSLAATLLPPPSPVRRSGRSPLTKPPLFRLLDTNKTEEKPKATSRADLLSRGSSHSSSAVFPAKCPVLQPLKAEEEVQHQPRHGSLTDSLGLFRLIQHQHRQGDSCAEGERIRFPSTLSSVDKE